MGIHQPIHLWGIIFTSPQIHIVPIFLFLVNDILVSHLWKYVYEVHARPRLVSGEELGEMQEVTRADEIRQEHEEDIEIEANKILF